MPNIEQQLLSAPERALGGSGNRVRERSKVAEKSGSVYPRILRTSGGQYTRGAALRVTTVSLLRSLQPQDCAQCLPLAEGKRLRALFGEIVTPHIGDGLKLAWHLTKSSTDAEDVVQEACLNALSALETYQAGNVRNWFLTIVRHAAYNWLRKNRRMRLVAVDNIELVEEENAQAQGHQTVTPETELIARQEAHQLSQMLEAMPDRFREALELRIKQQHSYREIAVILCVPVGTVMSRLARARQHLLNMVQNDRRP